MTAFRGRPGINKRPGELAIHSVDHFSLAVPDLAVARTFYTAFGLTTREAGSGLELYATGSDHRWATVIEGASKRLRYLSFGVFEEDFEPMKRKIERAGIELRDAPPNHDSAGIWLEDPFGVLL